MTWIIYNVCPWSKWMKDGSLAVGEIVWQIINNFTVSLARQGRLNEREE